MTTLPDDRRWRPAPLIKASALLHAGALAATILPPGSLALGRRGRRQRPGDADHRWAVATV